MWIADEFELSLGSDKIKMQIGRGLLENITEWLKMQNPHKIIVITDSKVESLYGDIVSKSLKKAAPVDVYSFPEGEKSKNVKTLEMLLEKVAKNSITKNSYILSLGGGVVSNTTGMVAGLLFRGLPLVHIPTTIMAQIDASISRKQAVNGKNGKNMIGLWKAPEAIFIDFDFLKTLDRRQIRTGIAESIKLALIADLEFYELLESVTLEQTINDLLLFEKILIRSIELTCKILNCDPFEGTSGLTLEIGHTIGHAIEILKQGEISHGEAISIGMVIESRLSAFKDMIEMTWPDRIKETLQKFELPTEWPIDLTPEKVMMSIRFDNKRRSEKPSFVPMNGIGRLQATLTDEECCIDLENLKKSIYQWQTINT